MSTMTSIEQLEQAIASLEAQRSLLGDAVVETMLTTAREKLAALRAQAAPTEQQRKYVTILFADISGFTALSETLDAEELTGLMNAVWERLDQLITQQGGRIDKHIGDAVMAMWGAERAREDDPEQALRAALSMQAELTTFREQHRLGLAMRIGLNTGPVLVGVVATTHEFTAMGDAVNLASRLEHAAPVGGVLISADTYRHVRGLFEVEPQPPLAVKGKRDPVQTYRVKAVKPRAFRVATRGVEGIETRTIGREAELLTLQTIFREAAEKGETHLLTLVGEPGVGKSRLLYEFENWVEILPQRTLYFKGRAVPEMRHHPAALLRDLFSFRFEIRDADSVQVMREKFLAGMAKWVEPDMAAILGQLAGFDFSQMPAVQAALANPNFDAFAVACLVAYFQALAETTPVLVLLEDIHWADERSLDLIDRLLKALPARRLLVVCLTRPTLYEHRPSWGEGRAHTIRLDLKPLSPEGSRALVEEILQHVESLPTALRETIVSQAEGNPFYIEELIKMLLDEGVIVRALDVEARWQVQVERLDKIHVPTTLTAVLQARLDGLPPSEREVLQRASVIGRQFWDTAVDYLAEEGHTTLAAESLPALRVRELVFRHEHSAFEGAQEYLFKHALLRDVAYESVLRRLRRAYHRQAAEWLIRTSGARVDEYASLIAEHFVLAEDSRREAEWQGRAAKQAAAQYAHPEALRRLNRALELSPADDIRARFDLLLERVQIYGRRGQRELQHQDSIELEALAERLNDPARRTDAALQRGEYHRCVSDFPAALEAGQWAVQWAEATNDLSRQADARLLCAMSLYRMDNRVNAKSQLEEGLALARIAGNRRIEGEVLLWLSGLASIEDDLPAQRARIEEALHLFRGIGDIYMEGQTLRNLGLLLEDEKDYLAAQIAYEQALQLLHKAGDQANAGWTLRDLGGLALELGDYATAQVRLGQALDTARKLGDRHGECLNLHILGLLALNQCDYPTAQTVFQQSLEIAHNRTTRANSLNGLGCALVSQGQFADARVALQQALEIYQRQNWLDLVAAVQAELAGVSLAQGDLAEARQHTEMVLRHLETGNVTRTTNPMRTYLLCLHVLHATSDPRAFSVLERAYNELNSIAARLDESKRRSYLENVPAHREIMTLWHTKVDS